MTSRVLSTCSLFIWATQAPCSHILIWPTRTSRQFRFHGATWPRDWSLHSETSTSFFQNDSSFWLMSHDLLCICHHNSSYVIPEYQLNTLPAPNGCFLCPGERTGPGTQARRFVVTVVPSPRGPESRGRSRSPNDLNLEASQMPTGRPGRPGQMMCQTMQC